MTILYVIIGLAVVYAAFAFGAKRNSSQARLAGHFNEPAPGSTHSHATSDSSHVHGNSEETNKQHKSHGGGC